MKPKRFPIAPKGHPMRRKLTAVQKPLPDQLEAQAAKLREMAANWFTTGDPPEVEMLGKECSINVLSYTDLIDDAQAFEADARKLRNLY